LLSDVPDRSAGLQIELWERGQFWDKLLGLCHIRLDRHDEHGEINSLLNTGLSGAHERWIILDAELMLNRQGQVARTCHPTAHSILIRTYIELPSDLTEEESKELTEKLEILHDILDKEVNIYRIFFLYIFFFCSLEFCRSHVFRVTF
jgi:hypothetical protein